MGLYIIYISSAQSFQMRPDTLVEMVNSVPNTRSYNELILLKSVNSVQKTKIYNISISDQFKLQRFLHSAVNCPSDSVIRNNGSDCFYYIPHNSFTRICCDANLNFIKLNFFHLTMNLENTLYLLQNMTAKLTRDASFDDSEANSKRLIIANFHDNIPNQAMKVIDASLRIQLEKFLITSLPCNDGLGRVIGNRMCYRRISHQHFYLCCNENSLPKFLYFDNLMLKNHELSTLMKILQEKRHDI